MRTGTGSSHRAARWGTTAAAVGAVVALAVQGGALASPLATPALPALPTLGTGASLAADVLPDLAGYADHGATPSAQPVEVGITLANPNLAAQHAAFHGLYTKGSPTYHHFLTAAQVASQFGVPAATVAAVRSWATSHGLAVVSAPATGEYLLLQGSAAQAEATFGVTLHDFTSGAKAFYANTNAPTVPAGLGIDGVIGLNSLLGAHTTDTAPVAGAPHGVAAPKPAQTTCAAGVCTGLTTPQDLWSIYQQPTNIADPAANFGQGQQLAVLGEGAVSGVVSDLRMFEAEHGLPKMPVTIKSQGDDFADTSGSPEWDIDMQASTGMAPKGVNETLYFAKDLTDASVLADITAWSSDPTGPYQANASFGECEQDPTTPLTGGGGPVSIGAGLAGTAGAMFTQASENSLEQATLQGKTLFSSTGDTGSSCPVVYGPIIGAGNGVANQAFPETNYPASSPYVTAVGGTVLYGSQSTATAPASNSQRVQETAWTFTGGGNTFYIPEPDYQRGIPMLDAQNCLAQPTGTPYASPTACRGIPDVAAQSGDVLTNGYSVTMAGVNDQAGGGTSLSSPLWMGMWTRMQASAPLLNGKWSLGFANCDLYTIGLDPHFDSNDFFDIGGGGVASPVTSDGLYTSLPRSSVDPSGWDYVSGLGAPNVTNLGRDLTGNVNFTPTHPVAAAPAVDCGQPGEAVCKA